MKNKISNQKITKSGKNIIIRRPTTEDAESMVEYFNMVGGESNNLMFGKDEFNMSVNAEQRYIESINEERNSMMIIGIIEDEIVAAGQIVASKRKRVAHNSHISLSVKKNYWDDGIGSLLISEFIKFAKSTNITKNINLTVNSENFRGIALYKKFNFVEVGTHKNNINIDGKYYDELIMDLYI